jgi:2-dehydropantoate 2-reductase
MARVAVVGVGAIGGVLAGLLQASGAHELSLCTRRPVGRLTVETPEGVVHVEAQNFTDPAQATVVDWVVVATKTYDSAGAKLWLRGLCGEGTQIAVVQNGVEHRENFAPEWAVVPVVIDVPTERRPDGSILQRSKAVMRVEDSDAGRAFAALFAGTAAEVDVIADFVSAAWGKLCINAAGVISGLTLKPAGIFRDATWGRVALDLVAECVAVGRAEGAVLDDGVGERIVAGYRAGSPDSINSLLADRMAGRPMEIEARNGVIVRRGEIHGIATPLNRMAVALLTEMAR